MNLPVNSYLLSPFIYWIFFCHSLKANSSRFGKKNDKEISQKMKKFEPIAING